MTEHAESLMVDYAHAALANVINAADGRVATKMEVRAGIAIGQLLSWHETQRRQVASLLAEREQLRAEIKRLTTVADERVADSLDEWSVL
jgi:hypothetical protein